MAELTKEKPEANEEISISGLLEIAERNRGGLLRRLGLKEPDKKGITKELDAISNDALQSHVPRLQAMLESETQLSVTIANPMGGTAGNAGMITDIRGLLDVIGERSGEHPTANS